MLEELSEIYPHIRYYVVLAYMPIKKDDNEYLEDTKTIYPDGLEKAPYRLAIIKRNEWMIKKADIVVCYIETVIGGAYQAIEAAKRKNREIINLSENSLID